MRSALTAALAFLPALVWAQSPLPQRLYVDPGALLGSSRVVSLGGAYVGVGEGADGMTSNLASISHRDPALERSWDIDAMLSWIQIQLGNPQRFDLDNSGSANGAQSTSQVLAGLLLQYGRFGLGTYFRISNFSYCTDACPASPLGVQFTKAVVALSAAFHRDELLVAFGFYNTSALFTFQGQGWQFSGTGIELDALYRPIGAPYRMGISAKPQVVGPWMPAAGQAPMIDQRQLYSAIVSPSVLSVGMSYKLGEGAENYNRLSPAGRKDATTTPETAALLPPELPPGVPVGRWLLAAQLDLVQSADNAVALRALINQNDAPVAVKDALVPRFGAEYEAMLHRLRTRLGTYLEPSAYSGIGPRAHLTGGFELNVFHALEDWSVGASFDVAQRYSNLGLAIGWWH